MIKFLFLFFLLLPAVAFYYAYKHVDFNKEPKRAILFTLFFASFVWLIEFMLVKPAIGKILGFYDPYLFVYYLTEEQEHLQYLSNLQKVLILFLSSLSKAFTYGVGLKLLYVNLYKIGKSAKLAGKHFSLNGFLEEPIDYIVYCVFYFSTISLFEVGVNFRLDSFFSKEKLTTLLLIAFYLVMSFVISSMWLFAKIKFKTQPTQLLFIDKFVERLQPNLDTKFLFFVNVEIWSILTLLVSTISLNAIIYLNNPVVNFIFFVIFLLIIKILLQQVKLFKLRNFTIKK